MDGGHRTWSLQIVNDAVLDIPRITSHTLIFLARQFWQAAETCARFSRTLARWVVTSRLGCGLEVDASCSSGTDPASEIALGRFSAMPPHALHREVCRTKEAARGY